MTLREKYLKWFMLICLIITSLDLAAQRPMRRPPPARQPQPSSDMPLSNSLKDRLWYGGSIALGFTGNNFESLFLIGVAPMVGYKITPQFSVGPRVEFNYTYYKTIFFGGGPVTSYNLFSGGIGPFARYKFFNILFAQLEYQVEWAQFPTGLPDGSKSVSTFDNLFIGLGYNAGGGEILILYNLLDQSARNSLDLPINIRFGFTINF
jgi:hypothetical protein